jgi:hypothetical protein
VSHTIIAWVWQRRGHHGLCLNHPSMPLCSASIMPQPGRALVIQGRAWRHIARGIFTFTTDLAKRLCR